MSKWEVTLVSGDAEAAVLVAAASRDEAISAAVLRAEDGAVCWEGEPDESFWVAAAEDLGEDDD